MPRGPLRTAIETAANENFTPQGGPGWWERVKARWTEWGEAAAKVRQEDPVWWGHVGKNLGWGQLIYALFGSQASIDAIRDHVPTTQRKSLSEAMAEAIAAAMRNPIVDEMAETFGALLTEPILSFLDKYFTDQTQDPREAYRALHGIGITFNIAGALADLAIEAATGGQIEAGAIMADNINRAAGLHLLNWSALSPALDAGLKPSIERFYSNRYRPARFGASDLRDLYALGEISRGELEADAKDLGWRDRDIDKWIQLAFRTLAQGDIFKAYNEGFISQDQATRRLRALGYDPADIPLLFQLNPKEEQDTAKNFTVSTARAAYRNNLMSETELRGVLKELKYQDREIELILQLENLNKEQDTKTLALGQIKSAWTENVITDPEARVWLERSGFGLEEIELILETWKAELIPPYRKLNAGTVTGAYVGGIIDRGTTLTKLRSIGFTPEDAELEVRLVEVRNPAIFGGELLAATRQLTPGVLSDLFTAGVITEAALRDRLHKLGYLPTDADLLVEAAKLRLAPIERRLPQASVERGYLAGVLDRAGAFGALRALGYSEASANTILDTLEAENPAAFGLPAPERIKQLGPSVLEDLVIAGLITTDTMRERLLELNFTPGDAQLLTDRAAQLAAPPVRVLNQSAIERAYLAGIIDRTGALGRLALLDLTPEDALLIISTLEQEHPEVFNPSAITSTRLPSITTLAAAVQNEIITEDEYFTRAVEIGYSPTDAAVYLALATRAERKSTTALSPSQLINAYGGGFLSWGEALGRLSQKGYSDPDAVLLLRMEKDAIPNTDIWVQLLQGAISPFDALSQLLNARYNDQDILGAFANLTPGQLGAMGVDLTTLEQFLAETPGGQ